MWNPYCNNHYAKFERVTVYYPKSCCNIKPKPPISTTTTSTSTSTSTTTTTTTICQNCVAHDVTISTQTWAGCNLNVDKYSNDESIYHAETIEDWIIASEAGIGAWCYYDNNPANEPIYGKLYNWYAVNDPRGLAPIGYHVPTREEIITLTNNLVGPGSGGALKEAGLCHWNPNEGGTNSSGFTALPGGSLYIDGINSTFTGITGGGYWWCSSEDTTPNAWSYFMGAYISSIYILSYPKMYGFSVRLIKN